MATNCLRSIIAVHESNRRSVLAGSLRESNVARSNSTVGALNFGRPLICKAKVKVQASLFPPFLKKKKDRQILKEELLEAIAPLDRGAEATPDDQYQVDQIARELEIVNPTKNLLRSTLLNGKWELLYTTSETILKRQRPKLLRPNGPIYQAINIDTLRAQNLETWPFFNQVTANLTPINGRRVAVKFDTFKIGGLVNIKAPERARGELEITYLDDELRDESRVKRPVGPRLDLTAEQTVQCQLDALKYNNEPHQDHGIEVMYRFTGFDPFERSKYFGPFFDLGQFERFRRIFHHSTYRVLLSHKESKILSSLYVGENCFKQRVWIRGSRPEEEEIFEFTMIQQVGGCRDGYWLTESLRHDGEGITRGVAY